MKHLGDICKISGRDAPVVNVIIGGSPCQDLSIAGKRAGLGGQRSGLFMEQIRIIKEMRAKDALSGRKGADIRPRFMEWENVPGAFSVNGGRDFAAVLEETIRVVEQETPDILPPAKGWTNSGCYMGDGWSVAWRILDAQFWGVPQRRRRIALVADFGGGCAPEILFEREGSAGDFEPCSAAEQGTSGDAADGFGVYCLQGNGIDRSDNAGCAGRGWTEESCYTLNTVDRPAVVYPETSRALCARADSSPCVDRGQEFVCIEKPISFLERAGCPGGGKGILVQQDKVGTLSTLQNQSVCYPINTMVASRDNEENRTTLGIGENGDPQFTLSAAHEHAVCYAKTTKPHSKDEAPTIKETEIIPTLSTFDVGEARTNTFVCFESHGQDSRYRPLGETSETISAKYGMGGGNQPIVICCGNGQGDIASHITEEQAQTLNCMHDQQIVAFDQLKQGQFGDGEKASTLTAHLEKEARDIVCAAVDIRNGSENPSINGTLQAKENGGTSLNLNNVVRQRYIVRRLTPLECERLQGYPDGWTDIGEWTDTKGKKHKPADSPRYKALGNSIAIPPWLWVLSRLNAYCEEKTMASLFDGIGGFPLIWEFLNGKVSAVWCSEIEEFPIAVTKRRFSEDDA